MDKGIVHVIFGEGRGKTSMALGRGIGAVARGQRVIIVQFLKGALSPELSEWMKRLEPDMKIFRFEKQGCYFESLSENEKKEEEYNIQNGINFARKVLSTGECDLLILDEFLGILDQNMISLEAAAALFALREGTDLLLTGTVCPPGLKELADETTRIEDN